jgi:hypothetical protein
VGRSIVLLLALSGCADVFDLEYVAGPPACSASSGHDEDGDLLDDACDPCPGDVEATAADRDGDGIGDACDPDPDVGGNTLMHFYSFASASDGDHFGLQTGWSVVDDALVYAPLTPTTFIELTDPTPALPYAVQIAATIDAADRTMYDQIAATGNSSEAGGALQCVVFHAPAGNDGWQAAAGAQTDDVALAANTYVGGTSFVARMRYLPDGETCDLVATRSNGDPTVGTTTITGATAGPGTFALNVQETQVHIAWIAMYTLP